MGYTIYQLKSDFFIPKELFSEALASIKKYANDLFNKEKKIPFIEVSELENSESLEDALVVMRWLPELNEHGDIIDIEFSGEKLGDDFLFFSSIAQYVKEGSYITLISEDSKVWRWIFVNKKIEEQQGIIKFGH